MVRNDRRRGRTVECFVDDRCKIFYAPRSKMKKILVKTGDDTNMRPSYRKIKDAHDRSMAINGEKEDGRAESAKIGLKENSSHSSNNDEEIRKFFDDNN